MALFLTPEELHELTGLRVAAYQCRWLEKHGYPFETNASGKPKVLTAFVLSKLGAGLSGALPAGPEPNFDAIA